MASTQRTTFRPTVSVWPAEPPDLPPLVPEALVLPQPPDGRVLFFGDLAPVEVPEDFVLRECLDLDPDDEGALLVFLRTWGRLTPRGSGQDPLGSLPGLFFEFIADAATRAGIVRLLKSSNRGRGHLEFERLYARTLRALALHYRASALGDDVVEVWRSEGFRVAADTEWPTFARVMDAGLRAFPVHVRLDGQQQASLPPSTYETAVLQLARMLAQGRQVLLCANERCRRGFTRQRGRARYPGAEHARGVRYCSRECARAQAERDRRARLAAETGAGR